MRDGMRCQSRTNSIKNESREAVSFHYLPLHTYLPHDDDDEIHLMIADIIKKKQGKTQTSSLRIAIWKSLPYYPVSRWEMS